jgi:hypothetical protein
MTKGHSQSNYIGSSPGIHSIQEKDDYFETDQEGFGQSPKQGPGSEKITSKIANHYEVPNMTSMLYEFTNKEQDRIHQSFRVGNYVSLRDIPDSLLPGNVSSYAQSKQEENLYSIIERRSWVELSKNGGYFSKFTWQEDAYDNFKDSLKSLRLKHDKRMFELHGHAPFINNPERALAHRHESNFQSLNF